MRHPRPGSDINYFLPKPIKPLIRWVLSPGPIMEINREKSPRPFETWLLSCLALRRSSIAIILFAQLEALHLCPLCPPSHKPPDLREIVFVLQSQNNSFHVRQAERRKADLLKQAQSLTEVRVDVAHTRGLTEILEVICEGNFYRRQLNLHEYEPCEQAFAPALFHKMYHMEAMEHSLLCVTRQPVLQHTKNNVQQKDKKHKLSQAYSIVLFAEY